MSKNKKLLIIGHGRHGKDTVAEILRDYHGREFVSSSLFCAGFVRKYLWNSLTCDEVYYDDEDCFSDRHSYRDEWFKAISEYNTPDKSRTAREMLEQGNDIYVGMRSREEFESCKRDKLFDCVVWVDRSDHLFSEPSSSMELDKEDADLIIDNNSTKIALWLKVLMLVGLNKL